jgi:phosphoglucomutase
LPGALTTNETLSALAGRSAPKELLVDLAGLEREYFAGQPDPADPNQLVIFGTSGHRGSPLDGTFTEAHILAITQAICDFRAANGIDVVITPSHNPPEDGGFKYNPTNGGPADTSVTHWIENHANELLKHRNAGVKRIRTKPL